MRWKSHVRFGGRAAETHRSKDRHGRCGPTPTPTCLPVRAGSTCALFVTDVSRRVVGWSIADHLRTELVETALRRAVSLQGRRHTGGSSFMPTGAVIHIDSAGQRRDRAGSAFVDWPVRCVLGDNAQIESFWSTLKSEFYDRRVWATRPQAHEAVGTWDRGDLQPQSPALSPGYEVTRRVRKSSHINSGRGRLTDVHQTGSTLVRHSPASTIKSQSGISSLDSMTTGAPGVVHNQSCP